MKLNSNTALKLASLLAISALAAGSAFAAPSSHFIDENDITEQPKDREGERDRKRDKGRDAKRDADKKRGGSSDRARDSKESTERGGKNDRRKKPKNQNKKAKTPPNYQSADFVGEAPGKDIQDAIVTALEALDFIQKAGVVNRDGKLKVLVIVKEREHVLTEEEQTQLQNACKEAGAEVTAFSPLRKPKKEGDEKAEDAPQREEARPARPSADNEEASDKDRDESKQEDF